MSERGSSLFLRPKRQRPGPSPRPLGGGLDIAFGLIFGLGALLVVAIWGAIGFGLYSLAADPEGVGRFADRIIGGAINGAREGR